LNKIYEIKDENKRLFNDQDDKKSINGIAISDGNGPDGVFIARKEENEETVAGAMVQTVTFAFLFEDGTTLVNKLLDKHNWLNLNTSTFTVKNILKEPLHFGKDIENAAFKNTQIFVGVYLDNKRLIGGKFRGQNFGKFIIKKEPKDLMSKGENAYTFVGL